MIQKSLIIILGTEPRILCSEVIRKNNSSMTQLIVKHIVKHLLHLQSQKFQMMRTQKKKNLDGSS